MPGLKGGPVCPGRISAPQSSRCPPTCSTLSPPPTPAPAHPPPLPSNPVRSRHPSTELSGIPFGAGAALPANWSLPLLTSLSLAGSGASGANASSLGPLPPAWATSLPALRSLGLSSMSVSTPLPPAWSTLTALTAVDLYSLSFPPNSTLPTAWASLPLLASLRLSGVSGLRGEVPGAWRTAGALPALASAVFSGVDGLQSSLEQYVQLAALHPQLTRLEASGLSPPLNGTIPPALFANQW